MLVYEYNVIILIDANLRATEFKRLHNERVATRRRWNRRRPLRLLLP